MIRKFSSEAEWLNYKESRIGGTAISSILGINKFQSALELYKRMKGIEQPIETNDLMQLGIHLEPGLLNMFQHEYGGESYFNKENEIPIFEHPDYQFIGASPDGYFTGTNIGDVIVEVKTTLSYISIEADLPAYWLAQLNFNIGLAKLNGLNVNKGVFVVLSSGRLYFFEYDFNEEAFDGQVKAAITFKEMLDNDIPPSPKTDNDFDYFDTISDKAIYGNELIIEQLQKIKEIKERMDELEKEKKFLTKQVKKYLGDSEYLLLDNGDKQIKAASYRYRKIKRFQPTMLKEADPDLYDKYTKETDRRVLIINYRNL